MGQMECGNESVNFSCWDSEMLQTLCSLSQQHICVIVIGISPNTPDIVSCKQKYSAALFCGVSVMQTQPQMLYMVKLHTEN